jgi:RNA polymerase sigma-70 factor (sigma-E family)
MMAMTEDDLGFQTGTKAVGDHSMAALFERHAPSALRLAYLLTGDRQVAEDLVQDAFVKMFRRWRDLRDPGAFDAYLKKTVVNLARSGFRRKRLERAHLERERRVAPVQQVSGIEDREQLLNALAKLPPRQRAAVVLRHLEDLSEQQTAHVLDCSVSAVKSASSRGIAKLREELRGERHG